MPTLELRHGLAPFVSFVAKVCHRRDSIGHGMNITELAIALGVVVVAGLPGTIEATTSRVNHKHDYVPSVARKLFSSTGRISSS